MYNPLVPQRDPIAIRRAYSMNTEKYLNRALKQPHASKRFPSSLKPYYE